MKNILISIGMFFIFTDGRMSGNIDALTKQAYASFIGLPLFAKESSMEAFIQGIGNWLVSTLGILGLFILLVLIFFWWVIPIMAFLAIIFAVDFFIRLYEYARGRRETIFDPSSRSSGYCGYTGTASGSGDCDSGGNNDSPGDYGPTPGYGGTI